MTEHPPARLMRVSLTAPACAALLGRCRSPENLAEVHAAMIRRLLLSNLHLATALLSRYAAVGAVDRAITLFSSAPAPLSSSSDAVPWNVMIRASVDHRRPGLARRLYSMMRELGLAPDNLTFPFVLKACSCLRQPGAARRVHGDVVVFGYARDVPTNNSLISVYGKCGLPGDARRVFDRMPERTQVSWSAMIGACGENGLLDEGIALFRRMLVNDHRFSKPTRSLVLNLIPCVYRIYDADEIYKMIVGYGLDFDVRVQNAVIVMYARCGRIDIARKMFSRIGAKDLICWSTMIEAYAQVESLGEALSLFNEMRSRGIRPDHVCLLSLLRACLSSTSFLLARVVHGFVVRNLSEWGVSLETAVVDLYVKCGSLDYARKVFDWMQERNLISWSTMISGYGRHGRGKDALELFEEMKYSTKPDHITFVSLLSACSHCGLVGEGFHYFDTMVKDYKIAPSQEHYAVMVDLLGRAGRFDEAVDLIAEMPIKPNKGVFGALLGACRIHTNANIAELASKSMLELDKENSGRYVVLSNIFLSSGKSTEADKIRALMKRRGVKKNAGHAVIEAKLPHPE